MTAKILKNLGIHSTSAWLFGSMSQPQTERVFKHAVMQPKSKSSRSGTKLQPQVWYEVLCIVVLDYDFREEGGREGKRMMGLCLTTIGPIWGDVYSPRLCACSHTK